MATLSSHLHRWHRSFMRHISHEVGARAALLYQEIRRCLGLRGGRMINGTKWIYKTMKELADRFGFSIRDIQRHLKTLCDLGWLKREQLERKQYKRRYWYTYGDTDPFTEAKSCPVRDLPDRARDDDDRSGSFPSSRRGHTGHGRQRRWEQSSGQPEQPHAIPNAEETKRRRLREEAMVFVPAPGGRRGTCPAETHATRSAAVGFG